MPSKHIDDSTWRRVESETVKAVIATRTSLKDTEILKLLILKGLDCITEDDYRQYLKEKGRD
ncbi:hypothetical protein [Aeromonas salmonicida]|jgi:hypothetical protein|uniref:hypothetical protein n=1 Tax=Aeromonas salmonicida TaxID=645 RepID=UPI000B3FA40D|nr:hypothetical protein [Aeromonas salmonicida]ARW82150.1 hypothetical protein O23A_p1407 [Aeromonas salmonicida]